MKMHKTHERCFIKHVTQTESCVQKAKLMRRAVLETTHQTGRALFRIAEQSKKAVFANTKLTRRTMIAQAEQAKMIVFS